MGKKLNITKEKQQHLIKVCEGFSQAFLIEVIWGKEQINASYRSMISKRLKGTVPFTILEIEKLGLFFTKKQSDIDIFLKK